MGVPLPPDWPFSRKPGRSGAPQRPWVFVRPSTARLALRHHRGDWLELELRNTIPYGTEASAAG